MQSWQMLSLAGTDPAALQTAMEGFDNALVDGAITRALPGADDRLSQRHVAVRERWRTQTRPLLESNHPDAGRAVETLVGELNALVSGLQQQAETRIQMLRLIQGVAIFITIGLVFGTMYLLHTGVVSPLRQLRRAAEQARRGNLSARVSRTGDDELGRMGQTFNTMADSIQQMQRDLELEVSRKTADLQRSNDALQLLYQTARLLVPDGPSDHAVQAIIDRLREVGHCERVTICLDAPDRHGKARIHVSPAIMDGDDCDAMHAASWAGSAGTPRLARFSLRDKGMQYGELILRLPPEQALDDWKRHLVEAVADQLATALARARQVREQRRLGLLEERAVIARELHDSLAQSLSYLKIQVSRLQTMRRRGEETVMIGDEPLAELRRGIDDAYRHLRELLDNFRLTMNEPGLVPALEAAVAEFSTRGGIPVTLRCQPSGESMDSNREIHLLHIVREALSNVVNHAAASAASVELLISPDGHLSLCIEDNGDGIPDAFERSHHYGTRIMQERARSLGGHCRIRRREGGGTRVEIVCPPPGGNAPMTESMA